MCHFADFGKVLDNVVDDWDGYSSLYHDICKWTPPQTSQLGIIII